MTTMISDSYGYTGGYGNTVLYRMCEEQPNHSGADSEIITSKIWIIGRSYAAAIERGVDKNKFDIKNKEHVKQLTTDLQKSKLDDQINEIRRINRITEDNLELLLNTHKTLVDIFFKHTGMHKRSLASKYLHFHAPNAVFIYDSIASGRLRDRYLRQRVDYKGNHDNNYEQFCLKMLKYREEELEPKLGGIEATPRILDAVLMGFDTVENIISSITQHEQRRSQHNRGRASRS